MSKVYLVVKWSCRGECDETFAVCSTKERADQLAARGGMQVKEMEVDEFFLDQYAHLVGYVAVGDVGEEALGPWSQRDWPLGPWPVRAIDVDDVNEHRVIAFATSPTEAKEKAWRLWNERVGKQC